MYVTNPVADLYLCLCVDACVMIDLALDLHIKVFAKVFYFLNVTRQTSYRLSSGFYSVARYLYRLITVDLDHHSDLKIIVNLNK